MSSPDQKRANRANARLSSGPKTSIGKERSSLNSLKHGLSSRRLLPPLRDHNFYKLLILNEFSEIEAGRIERAFIDLKVAIAAMADAYLEIPDKDLERLKSDYSDLLARPARSFTTIKDLDEYLRAGRFLASELSDPLDIRKRVTRAYPTARYQQAAAAELSKSSKSAKTNPI